jgi:hypothetical protein
METTTKQYTKLELPKDSAWDRKTYDPILLLYRTRNIKDKKEWPEWAEKLFDVWFVPKSAVQDFFDFIKRLRIWIPVLWKDRDWDDSYIFGIIKTKLITQRKYLVENYTTQACLSTTVTSPCASTSSKGSSSRTTISSISTTMTWTSTSPKWKTTRKYPKSVIRNFTK